MKLTEVRCPQCGVLNIDLDNCGGCGASLPYRAASTWFHISGEGNDFRGKLRAHQIAPMTALMLEFIEEAEREKRLPEYEI